jgi:hypothetical protein
MRWILSFGFFVASTSAHFFLASGGKFAGIT